MSFNSRLYDITIFGATGFTGERVCLYIAKYLSSQNAVQREGGKKRHICLAGRSEAKLKEIVEKMKQLAQQEQQQQLFQVSVLTASVENEQSLLHMTKQSKVIIDCVGPFRFYGEPVVKACIAASTHYVDITGEPEYIERMMVTYSSAAKDAKSILVPSCGFDSIPADLGCYTTTRLFEDKFGANTCERIDSILSIHSENGFAGHYGTWASLIHSVTNTGKLMKIRKELRASQEARSSVARLPGSRAPPAKEVFFDNRIKRYTMKFPGADASVVRNSEYQLSYLNTLQNNKNQKPTFPYYSAYFSIPSLFWVIVFMLVAIVNKIVLKIPGGKNILLNHPKLFSLGKFSHDGPTQQQLDTTYLTMDYFAYGAKDKNQALHTRLTAPEPGYVATVIFAAQAALTLLNDVEKHEVGSSSSLLPPEGGIWTSAAAFAKTDLMDRIESEQCKFEVLP